MKKIVTLVTVMGILLAMKSIAQKKLITNDSYKRWQHLKSYNISNDGKFVGYEISKGISGSTICIKSVEKNWEYENFGFGKVVFSSTNHQAIFQTSKDSIILLNLITRKPSIITPANSFELLSNTAGDFLVYRSDSLKQLKIINLRTDKMNRFSGVLEYKSNPNRQNLVMRMSDHLTYHDLLKGTNSIIDSLRAPNWFSPSFAFGGEKLVYLIKDSLENITRVRLYDSRKAAVRTLTDNHVLLHQFKFEIQGLDALNISTEGDYVIVSCSPIVESNLLQKHENPGKLMSYTDEYAGTELADLNAPLLVSINLRNHRLNQLTDGKLTTWDSHFSKYLWAFDAVNQNEYHWNSSQANQYLIDIDNGKRIMLSPIHKNIKNGFFPLSKSPNEKFAIWFDNNVNQYYTYETSTGITRNVSSVCGVSWVNQPDIPARLSTYSSPIWTEDEKSVIIRDRFDLWRIDPYGKSAPVNLTRGIGRETGTVFSLAHTDEKLPAEAAWVITGFDIKAKRNGFFLYDQRNGFMYRNSALKSQVFHKNSSEEMMSYGRHEVSAPPLKAKSANVYLLQGMSASESPNLFLSYDFDKFQRISNICPEKAFNWMTTELLSYRLSDGRQSAGILYKPQNLDSNLRYPVLVNFYERRSDDLNVYIPPGLSEGEINIPWYVSNGYLVFVPDIHYKTGQNYSSIVSSIKSGIEKISKFHYVDTTRMGVQGHSMGGYQTNMLITKMSIFKAAQESAGPVDEISSYLSFDGAHTRQTFGEFNQPNLGTQPWKDPETFIRNSPIFEIANINTPLLIMHNPEDLRVNFSQGVAMFTGLRRLRKPVWFLQYENEGHDLYQYENQLDFTVKQQEFFNHYLKGHPAPAWMK